MNKDAHKPHNIISSGSSAFIVYITEKPVSINTAIKQAVNMIKTKASILVSIKYYYEKKYYHSYE